MKIAFYAPMKTSLSDTPSGDRTIARLLIKCLNAGGHDVRLASALRSYVRDPADTEGWAMIVDKAEKEEENILESFCVWRPDVWFTYHLYYKAPDLLGSAVCRALEVPYVIAEASFAPKRAEGPWAKRHRLVHDAIAAAHHIFFLNPRDEACVLPIMAGDATHSRLPPITDLTFSAQQEGGQAKWAVSSDWRLPADIPWILTVGMMRRGDKQRSYKMLAEALCCVEPGSAALLVIGDGDASEAIGALFRGCPIAVYFLGVLEGAELSRIRSAADIFVWPALNEAVGMATLESMAAGLPVISGPDGSVAQAITEDAGIIAATPTEIGKALRDMIDAPLRRRQLGNKARDLVRQNHSVGRATALLNEALFRFGGRLS